MFPELGRSPDGDKAQLPPTPDTLVGVELKKDNI